MQKSLYMYIRPFEAEHSFFLYSYILILMYTEDAKDECCTLNWKRI